VVNEQALPSLEQAAWQQQLIRYSAGKPLLGIAQGCAPALWTLLHSRAPRHLQDNPMALDATVFKVDLQINDANRHYYQAHTLTLARHPSETDTRMMLRLVVFALFAREGLAMTKGISSDEVPDIWQKNLCDEIELWIDLGQPDEKRLRKACGRAAQVVVVCYAGQSAKHWWQQQEQQLARYKKLAVWFISQDSLNELTQMVKRSMSLTITLNEDLVWVSDDDNSVELHPECWKTP
jgi:uncharacterized protein YaeQ